MRSGNTKAMLTRCLFRQIVCVMWKKTVLTKCQSKNLRYCFVWCVSEKSMKHWKYSWSMWMSCKWNFRFDDQCHNKQNTTDSAGLQSKMIAQSDVKCCVCGSSVGMYARLLFTRRPIDHIHNNRWHLIHNHMHWVKESTSVWFFSLSRFRLSKHT